MPERCTNPTCLEHWPADEAVLLRESLIAAGWTPPNTDQTPTRSGAADMSAIREAWETGDAMDDYADLDPAAQALRDAALAELQANPDDPMAVLETIVWDNWDELIGFMSWLDTPAIWGPEPSTHPPRRGSQTGRSLMPSR